MTIKQVIAILESLKQKENTGRGEQNAGYNIAVRSFNTDIELVVKQLKQ